jgi:hypothetical protein
MNNYKFSKWSRQLSGNNRNQLCFCGSGLKYKKCHLLVEDRLKSQNYTEGKKLKLFELNKLIKETQVEDVCFGYNLEGTCSSLIINAHTLTRSLSLKAIEKNGHVYSFRNKDLMDFDSNNGITKLSKVGVKLASTFKGFCSFHDDKLFTCLEKNEFIISDEQVLSLLFRTCALEVYKKKKLLENHRTNFKTFLNTFDKRDVEFGANFLTLNLRRAKLDYDDIREKLDLIIEIKNSKNYERIRTYALKLKSRIPYVGSGVFAIFKDFFDEELQDVYDLNKIISYSFINIFYDKSGMAWILFNWLDSCDEVNQKFINEIDKLSDSEKINAFSNLILNYSENIFFNIDYIDNLSIRMRTNLETKFTLTMNGKFIKLNENLIPINCEIDSSYKKW